MSRADMSPDAISERLREVGSLSDLTATRRMATKVDMRPEAVSRRIAQVSELRDFCLALRAVAPVPRRDR